MTGLTKKVLKEMEEYYYWVGYKNWHPFPIELITQLMDTYGREPFPYEWSEQDIFEGSRKIIIEYFKNNSN